MAALDSHRSTNPTCELCTQGIWVVRSLRESKAWWSEMELRRSHHSQMGPSSCRKTSSGLPLILHYGELYNYFIIYYNVIIIKIKCTVNVTHLNHPETTTPQRWSMGKLSSMKPVPGAKKVGDHCPIRYVQEAELNPECLSPKSMLVLLHYTPSRKSEWIPGNLGWPAELSNSLCFREVGSLSSCPYYIVPYHTLACCSVTDKTLATL